MSKKFFVIAVLTLATLLFSCGGPSEKSLRSRVVQLTGNGYSCSGEQIHAKSGKDYILTAGHCHTLAVDGSIRVTTEDGKQLMRRVIEEDVTSDLMILEGVPHLRGVEIADSVSRETHVRTFTHGAGYATYKTDGELIGIHRVPILIRMMPADEDEKTCSKPKEKIMSIDLPWGPIRLCTLDVEEMGMTAMIVGGSSGGMVVDDSGRLVGVVSAGGSQTPFGWIVTMADIHKFVDNY